MNIETVIADKIIMNEINQNISKEELTQLRQALESQSEENQELKSALQDLRRVLETEKPGAAKAAASRLLGNIGTSALSNVLGGGTLAIIQKLAGM